MMIDPRHLDSGDNSSDSDDSRKQPPSPSFSSVDNSPGHLAHQETLQPPQDSSLVFEPSLQIPHDLMPGGSSSHILGRTPNPADTPSASNSSSPASPATPTNASPVSDSPPKWSAIQTVQTYITHQTQVIQSHLTAALPGLIQGEVRTQCAQLAQEIGDQISSIREEVIRPTGDQDDLMLPSSEEDENRGSRGRDKRTTSCNKGKGMGGRFATESDKAAKACRNHRHSQQPNNGDEADEEDEGSENESDEEEISAGGRKYKKKTQVLRVSIYSCSS
jgi:hypothetical protein